MRSQNVSACRPPGFVTLCLRETVAQVALCQPKKKRKNATTIHLLWTSSRYGKTPLLIDEIHYSLMRNGKVERSGPVWLRVKGSVTGWATDAKAIPDPA